MKQENNHLYPFHRIAIELFEYAGKDFLSIIDSYSGYLVVAKLNQKSASHIVKKLSTMFNHLGYPTEIKFENHSIHTYLNNLLTIQISNTE